MSDELNTHLKMYNDFRTEVQVKLEKISAAQSFWKIAWSIAIVIAFAISGYLADGLSSHEDKPYHAGMVDYVQQSRDVTISMVHNNEMEIREAKTEIQTIKATLIRIEAKLDRLLEER